LKIISRKDFGRFLSIIFFLFLTPAAGLANTSATNVPVNDIGSLLPLWSALPFAGILFSIAFIPLFAPHFWEHHFSESFGILGFGFRRAVFIFFPGSRCS